MVEGHPPSSPWGNGASLEVRAEVERGAQPWVLGVLSLSVLPLGKPWGIGCPTEEPSQFRGTCLPTRNPLKSSQPWSISVVQACCHSHARLPVSVDGTFPRCLALH